MYIMAKGYQLAISIFLITASIASIAFGSETPYSIDFDLRNMDGFNDNVISASNIEAFIEEKMPDSPMLVESDIGNCFINAGLKNSVNPAFLVSTACLEGGFGTLGWAQSHPECHNTFGYGIPSGTTPPDDYNCMDSWCLMIERVASVIAHGNNYYTNGLYTVSQVRGKYAASPNSDSIAGLMNELYAFSNLETATSNTMFEEPSSGMDQSQASNEFGGVEYPNGVTSFADHVVSYNPCNGVKAPRNNPNNALGSPDYNGVDSVSYVSLGNAENTCDCGSLVLEFIDNALVDVPGNDLYVYEVGPGVEATEVFISTDGQEWIDLSKIGGSLWGIDIHDSVYPGQEFYFVKLCDYPDGNTGSSPTPGPDIDAVGVIGNL